MRRTAVVSTCIAAFALLTSALNTPKVVPPKHTVRPAAFAAADRALGRISRAVPPVRGTARSRLAASTTKVPATAAGSERGTTVHVVESGDSLWTIARRHGVTVEDLAAVNQLRLTAILQLGQRLMVPAGRTAAAAPSVLRPRARPAARPAVTAVHVVRSGETLWEIAARYGTRIEDLMSVNDLGDSDWIKPGQRLQIAGGQVPRHRQLTGQTRSGRPVMAEARAVQAAGPFLWPARGTLTSRFGWRYRRHHDGIDIAAPRGTPIYAARDGTVTFAGWKGGYGRVVYLDHGADVVTVYGHASSLLVRVGQRVKKGQLIARVGCTGSCTGSHVHFEVRVSGAAQNPLPYLTSAQAKR